MVHRRIFLPAAVCCLLFLSACDNLAEPKRAPHVTPPESLGPSGAVAYEPDWNRYTADVVLTVTGGGSSALTVMPERTIRYRIERSRDTSGQWTSALIPQGDLTGMGREFSISKLVRSADGSARIFDTEGEEIEWVGPAVRKRFAQLAPRLATSPKPPARPLDFRGWANNVVIDISAGAARRERLTRAFGAPTRRDGLDEYRVERGAQIVETTVDPDRELVVQRRVFNGDRLVSRTTLTHHEIAPGRLLQTLTRTEITRDGNHLMVIERALTNVRFERTGGK
jgi:hypothetical protein